jgi:hypothetical protein
MAHEDVLSQGTVLDPGVLDRGKKGQNMKEEDWRDQGT